MKSKELEIWRDVKGYEGCYQASSLGRIKSLDRTVVCKDGSERVYRGRILKGSINKTTGYRQVGLSVNGKLRTFTASQLVALAFLNHTPDGHTSVVDHVNGNRLDDRVENLQIVTNRENSSTCYRSNKETLSSKYAGVSWYKRDNKWISRIQYEGKSVYLGLYPTELEAHEAYQKALAKI